MQKRLPLFIAAILLAPLSFAEPNPPADPVPTKADIPALIKQLGDDSPKIRDQASEKLRHLGADAIPALTQAEKSDDAEVVSRSQSIQRQIDEDLHPKPKVDPNSRRSTIILGNGQRIVVGGVAGGAGNVQIRVSTTVMNGNGRSVSITKTSNGAVKETTVNENGKLIKIHEDGNGIAVTITEKKDGKDVGETTKAKDKETLKKENPRVYEMYEKYSKEEVRLNAVPAPIRPRGLAQPQREVENEKKAEEAPKTPEK